MNVNELKYAIKNRRGIYPEEITQDVLRDAGCMPVVMPIPQDFMERTSHLGNCLAQMTMDSKCVKDDRLRSVVGQLCQALSYMFNSTSWQDGELHDFDMLELQIKLGRFLKQETTAE